VYLSVLLHIEVLYIKTQFSDLFHTPKVYHRSSLGMNSMLSFDANSVFQCRQSLLLHPRITTFGSVVFEVLFLFFFLENRNRLNYDKHGIICGENK